MTKSEKYLDWMNRVRKRMYEFVSDMDELTGEGLEFYCDEYADEEYAYLNQEMDVAMSNASRHVENALNDVRRLIKEEVQ